jgi:hypothetical protein
MAGLRRFAVHGFLRRPIGCAGDMFREDGREGRRHVLGDQDRQPAEHRREPPHQHLQGLRAAGRASHHEDARRHRRKRPQRDRARLSLRVLEPASGNGRSGRQGRPRTAAAELADFLDNFAPEILRYRDLAVGLGLGDIIDGTERKRFQRDFGVPARQRGGHDDHEVRLPGEQERQGGKPVELRHVDIENDDVGPDAEHVVYRLAPVAEIPGDFDAMLLADPPRQQTANDHGVIDDHHTDGGSRFARGNG